MSRLCHSSSGNAFDVQVFMPDILAFVEQLFRCLVVKVFALIGNLKMQPGDPPDRLSATVRPLLFARERCTRFRRFSALR